MNNIRKYELKNHYKHWLFGYTIVKMYILYSECTIVIVHILIIYLFFQATSILTVIIKIAFFDEGKNALYLDYWVYSTSKMGQKRDLTDPKKSKIMKCPWCNTTEILKLMHDHQTMKCSLGQQGWEEKMHINSKRLQELKPGCKGNGHIFSTVSF